jgi:hypothetical protein
MKKLSIVLAASFIASTLLVCGQAEQVKKRAKDLKRNVESGQTNAVTKTNTPAKGK